MKRLLNSKIFAFVFVAVIGTLFHFFYDWSNQSVIVSLFAPVNESVWEHTKMVFFPFLLLNVLRWCYYKERSNFWTVVALSSLVGILVIPVGYYFYTFFIDHQVWIDIGLFLIAVLLQELVFVRLVQREQNILIGRAEGLITIITIVLAFVVFTFCPPRFELFRDVSEGTVFILWIE